jgi:hypothetical protein
MTAAAPAGVVEGMMVFGISIPLAVGTYGVCPAAETGVPDGV